MKNKHYEPCVNMDTTESCYYHIKPVRDRSIGLTCDSDGICNPIDVDKCSNYDPENFGSVKEI